MSAYTFTVSGAVIRASDGACIPANAANADWQAFQQWLAAGNQADPYVPPAPPVPDAISDRQFFQQLAISGLITQAGALAAVKTGEIPSTLQALINAMPSGEQFEAEMLVAGATVFQRNHPMTIAIGAAYGWTGAQMDDLWRAAAAL